jgi:chemotaxis family two-component system sensor kinase Cph1
MNPSPAGAVDLEQCDREAIHLLGGIQPHGALLDFDAKGAVVIASSNTDRCLGRSASSLLGRPLADLFSPSSYAELRQALLSTDLTRVAPLRLETGSEEQYRRVDGLLHRIDGLTVLELEGGSGEPQTDPFGTLRSSLGKLRSAANQRELCQRAAEEVRKLTGFNRVMVYLFDPDWNGEVVGEARDAFADSFAGMHFPASDIPAQARALYARNILRLIADVDAVPAMLIPAQLPGHDRPLDLSCSALRSVSPVHLQYLRNMGVAASMSISLLRDDGQLLGLIACHHTTPLHVPPKIRSLCTFLSELLSGELASIERRDLAEDVAQRSLQHTLLVEQLSGPESLDESLAAAADPLLALGRASGAALLLGDTPICIGQTPSAVAVKAIASWLDENARPELFATESLPRIFAPAQSFAEVASGLLAVRLTRRGAGSVPGHSPSASRYLLFFRPERIKTIVWAGNPSKALAMDEQFRLHPRSSFAAWEQEVRATSQPWTEGDLVAARALKGALVGVVLSRAEHLDSLNRRLARSNEELDAFSYTVSHDLKEPLRGVRQYVDFLREDHGEALGAGGREKLEMLDWLSARMGELLEGLFELSRVGRIDLARAEVSIQELVEDVVRTLVGRLEENRTEVRIPRPLPRLTCDGVRLRQVFANLISNGSKYNDKEVRWVEVGYVAPDEPWPFQAERPGRNWVFYVQDNGIGIPDRFQSAIFDMFRRLHPQEKFGGGTGAGLPIARRIVERHGGQLWLQSESGIGTTFIFTLPLRTP